MDERLEYDRVTQALRDCRKFLYGNKTMLRECLAEFPELVWDGLLCKCDGDEIPLEVHYRCAQLAVFNLYGPREQQNYSGALEPLNPAMHAELVTGRARRALMAGWNGVLFDAEMYGTVEHHLAPDLLTGEQCRSLSSMWAATAKTLVEHVAGVTLGGTSFIRSEPHPVYDAIVRGVSSVIPWTELTQATHAGGHNDLVDAMTARYWGVEWIGAVLVRHATVATWFFDPARWPRGSKWCANNAADLIAREASEPGFTAAMFGIGN
jgi:hypothetical protein